MKKPQIAVRYEVEFKEIPLTPDEFVHLLRRLEAVEPRVIVYEDDEEETFELSKRVLETLSDLSSLGKSLRNFAVKLLNDAEPNVDCVRIEIGY